jgi:hypothetical protein
MPVPPSRGPRVVPRGPVFLPDGYFPVPLLLSLEPLVLLPVGALFLDFVPASPLPP